VGHGKSFPVLLQSTRFLGFINGAAHIPEEIIKRYKVSDFIKRKLQYRQRKVKKVA